MSTVGRLAAELTTSLDHAIDEAVDFTLLDVPDEVLHELAQFGPPYSDYAACELERREQL